MSALDVEAVFARRRAFWQHGYRPLEVWNPDQQVNDKGEPLNKPGKQPRGLWRKDASRNPPAATENPPDSRALNTGLACGEVVAFDVDVLDQALANQIVNHIEITLGPTPLIRVGRAPKILLVYRPDHPFTKVQTPELFFPDGTKAKVELLAEGQQFVADGIHPDTHKPFFWMNGSPAEVPIGELPPVTEDQARAITAEAERLLRAAGAKEKEKPRQEHRHGPNGTGGGFFAQVNAAALRDISAWARNLFPRARFEPGTGAWRVSSKDLGRDLEEDISIHPDGIWDFGEEIPLTAIDLVVQHGGQTSVTEAALWLCDRLHIDPASLGYHRKPAGARPPPPQPPEDQRSYDFGIVAPTRALLEGIKPRQWLYGTFLQRCYVCVLAGISGGGKSSFALTIAVSLAIGRSLFNHRFWRPLRVWYCNLDDPNDENLRRLNAILLHHKIDLHELGDRFLISGRNPDFVVARRREGYVLAEPIKDALIAELRARKLDVLIVDPFIRSHDAEENSNPEMARVMEIWISIAQEAGIAVVLLHHVRKGLTDADDQQSTRGAGTIVDLARTGLVLARMTPAEAKVLDIDDDKRRRYFRVGHAKASMAPPPTEAEWYRMASIELGNGDADYPDGDNVQAVERFYPPRLFQGLSISVLKIIFDRLRNGPEPGERYAPTRRGKQNDRWAGDVIMEYTDKNADQAREILSAWRKNKVVIFGDYASEKERKPRSGVTLNEAKVAEIVAHATIWEPEC